MIKVFTTNKNGKIELTKEELKGLLDEAYWEGYKSNNHTYTYQTPNWSLYQTVTNTADATIKSNNITSSNVTSGTIGNDCTVAVDE